MSPSIKITTKGGYLLMETSPKGVIDIIQLPSTMLNATMPEGRCVVFQ